MPNTYQQSYSHSMDTVTWQLVQKTEEEEKRLEEGKKMPKEEKEDKDREEEKEDTVSDGADQEGGRGNRRK